MGVIVESAPLTEVAELTRCPVCSSAVLEGHSSGMLARVDLVAVDRVTELAGRLLGRPSFDVVRWRSRYGAVLDYRIDPGQPRTGPVALAHRCPPGRRGFRELREVAPIYGSMLLGPPPAALVELDEPPF